MSIFNDPLDPKIDLARCTCGVHQSQHDHDNDAAATSSDGPATLARIVESAVVRALFPKDQDRRDFLRVVGSATAWTAISTFFPIDQALAAAAESSGPLEKKVLNIGFLPITCATPILLGKILGLYEKEGLQVKLHKAQGWGGVKEKTLNGEFDAAHMLAPLALGLRLGVDSVPTPIVAPLLENLNGNSLTLAIKHKDKRDPKQWSGFRFAIPLELSVQNFLLREYLLQNGLKPDRDVHIRAMAPGEMISSLKSGEIDGYIVAEPFGQRAVQDGIGFIHLLSSELWDGHPCCAFTTSEKLLKEAPNTFAALFRSVVRATIYTSDLQNISKVSTALAAPEYLNQPAPVIDQVLTGNYADGLGNKKTAPRRVAFEPFPWQSMGVWLLLEMKRWGYLKKDVDYKQIAESVFLATDARKHMLAAGIRPGKANSRKHFILGHEFDPERPDAYFAAVPAVNAK